MRTFLNGSGVDVTTTVVAALKTGSQMLLADLYLIGELEDPYATFLTNWEAPLVWSLYGKFKNATIVRGTITSKIGLAVDSLEITWSPALTALGTSLATANPYQKAQSGFYDNKKFRLWRTIMPTKGDCNTYGACEFFGGRVAESELTRSGIKFKVNSFLDVINQHVPPNVIDLNNIQANFAGNTPVVSDGETVVPQFTVATPTAATGANALVDILGTTVSPTANKIYGANKFRYGYMVFNAGSSLAGYWSPIASNGDYQFGGVGTHYNQFIVYAPFPWAPAPGDSFYCSIKPPINLQDAAAGFGYFGFPYVPAPETGV